MKSPLVVAADLVIDLEARTIHKAGNLVILTRTQWLLLSYIASIPDRVLLSSNILVKVWGPEYRDDLQFLNQHIYKLRRRVDPQMQVLKTVRGIGYILETEPRPKEWTPPGKGETVLAVDDDNRWSEYLSRVLAEQGFKPLVTSNESEAEVLFQTHEPALVLLDIVMPELTGIELLRRLRERSNVPIIFVTHKDKERDIIRGLELGADDYITKPLYEDELGARIRAVLRRGTRLESPEPLVVGDISIDFSKRQASFRGRRLELTRTDWALFKELVLSRDETVDRHLLLTRVWGPEYTNDFQYLRVWVKRLRTKLEDPDGDIIVEKKEGIMLVTVKPKESD